MLVVMGVSGTGKSTLASWLQTETGWNFQEGDALHPPDNIAKMAQGVPLQDADRWPWLDRVAGVIDAWRHQGCSGIVTCSALKRAYRDRIIGRRAGVQLVFLHGDPELLEHRLRHRRGHYMPVSLLQSQLDTLEPPVAEENPIVVEADWDRARMLAHIRAALRE